MAMQWRGWVKIDSIGVPCTGTGLKLTPGKNFSETIHEHGHVINYADGQNAYNGSIDFPFIDDMYTILKAWIITSPDTSKTVVHSPDGTATNTYTYPGTGAANNLCLVSSCTINGNMGGNLTVSLDLVATGRAQSGSAPTFVATVAGNLNKTPIPYWKSSFEYNKTGSDFGGSSDTTQVTAWSITMSRSPFVLYTFDGTQDPHDIQTGQIDVTGSVTIYNPNGTDIPTDGGDALLTTGTGRTWTLPYLVFTAIPQPISDRNTKAVRNLSFRGLGNVSNGPIY